MGAYKLTLSHKIVITLPSDRTGIGRLVYFKGNPDGSLHPLFQCVCRGKADSARALKEKNPDRHASLPYGDTPSGIFVDAKLQMFDKPHPRLGIGWIPLDNAVKGEAWAALNKAPTRSGLGIHGGRGDDELVATYGCVRLLDRDFKTLAALLRNATITIEIKDDAACQLPQ